MSESLSLWSRDSCLSIASALSAAAEGSVMSAGTHGTVMGEGDPRATWIAAGALAGTALLLVAWATARA